MFGKILLMSGLCFWVRSLFLRFFADVLFSVFGFFLFLRDKDQVVTGHPPHAHVFVVSVLFPVPPCLVYRPFWPCVLLLGVFFSGCHSGPRVFWGFSWNSWGLSSLAPSEAPSLGTRGGRGVSWLLVLGFCFSPFVFAASHILLEGPPLARPTARPGGLDVPPPRPSEGPVLCFCCLILYGRRSTGTLGRAASRAFLLGRGRFVCPVRPLCFKSTFCSRIFFGGAFGACACCREPDAMLEHEWNFEFRIPRADLRISRHSPRGIRDETPSQPRVLSAFCLIQGEVLSFFFRGVSSGDFPACFCDFSEFLDYLS